MTDAFGVLGLPPTADERAIKRAYAALLRVHRPDEDPADFQRINEAYAEALAQCRGDAPLPDEADRVRQAIWAAIEDAPSPDDGDAPALDTGTRTRAPVHTPEVHTPEAPAPAEAAPDAPCTVGDFLDALHERAMKGTADELAEWLQSHPALFGLHVKQALAPHVVALLEEHREVPGRQVETLLAFFGLDQVDDSSPVEQARVFALMARANPQIAPRSRTEFDDDRDGWRLAMLILWILAVMAMFLRPDR